jgi:hypothetical protein
MSLSPLSFEFCYDEIEFSRSASCGPNEVVTSATTSLPDSGVQLTWGGGTFTVSGTYHNQFPNSTWTYLPVDDPLHTVTVTDYNQVPSQITAFINGTHQEDISKPITYTVYTQETIYTTVEITAKDEEGKDYTYTETNTSYEDHVYSISHSVCNQWDIYKTQLQDILTRGTY